MLDGDSVYASADEAGITIVGRARNDAGRGPAATA
jgi:hypothetical protein